MFKTCSFIFLHKSTRKDAIRVSITFLKTEIFSECFKLKIMKIYTFSNSVDVFRHYLTVAVYLNAIKKYMPTFS